MLPFLKPKQVAGLIIEHRSPKGDKAEESVDSDDQELLESCMQEIIKAIKEEDPAQAARAFKLACQIVDMEPHKEGPHTDESDTE